MSKDKKSERLILMVDKPLRKALEKEQADSGASLSEIVRRALGMYLAKK